MAATNPPTIAESRLIIGDDGACYREETFAPRRSRVQIPISQILQSLGNPPLVLPPYDGNVFAVIPNMRQYLSSAGRSSIIAIKRLPKLWFDTNWSVAADPEGMPYDPPRVIPAWYVSSETMPDVRTFTWTPPANLAVLIGQEFTARSTREQLTTYLRDSYGARNTVPGDSTNAFNRFIMDTPADHPLWTSPTIPMNPPILVFMDTNTGRCYTPPLPNVYENGKLCTGGLDFTQMFFHKRVELMEQGQFYMTMGDTMDVLVNAWIANRWNSDLLERHERQHPAFRSYFLQFDADTGANCPPPEGADWTTVCRQVGTGAGFDTALHLFSSRVLGVGGDA